MIILYFTGLAITLGFMTAYAKHNFNNLNSLFYADLGLVVIVILVFCALWPIALPAFLVYKLISKFLKNKQK